MRTFEPFLAFILPLSYLPLSVFWTLEIIHCYTLANGGSCRACYVAFLQVRPVLLILEKLVTDYHLCQPAWISLLLLIYNEPLHLLSYVHEYFCVVQVRVLV